MSTIPSWSFSTWDTFENNCKRKIYYRKIEKLPDPPGPALARGSRIHKQLEDYAKYEDSPFPSQYADWQPLLDDLLERDFQAERSIAFDRDWNVVDWADGWLRLQIDGSCWGPRKIFTVVDYKTGKIWPNSKHQIELYSLAGLLVEPEAKKVHAELWYLDQTQIKDLQVKRSQVDELKEKWHARGEEVTSETNWDPVPSSFNCRFCAFAKSKGGPCDYG